MAKAKDNSTQAAEISPDAVQRLSSTETIEASTSVEQDGEKVKLSISDVEVPFPANVAEAVDVFGEETTLDLIKRSHVIKAQGRIRSLLTDGASDEEIREQLAAFNPAINLTPTRDPLSQARSAVGKMSEEEKAALRALLDAEG